MEEATIVDGGLPEDLHCILTQSLIAVTADIDDDDKVDELLPDISSPGAIQADLQLSRTLLLMKRKKQRFPRILKRVHLGL